MSWTSWLFYEEFIEGKDFSSEWYGERIEIESERHRHLRRTENGRGGSAEAGARRAAAQRFMSLALELGRFMSLELGQGDSVWAE